jgi:hypothetical protein
VAAAADGRSLTWVAAAAAAEWTAWPAVAAGGDGHIGRMARGDFDGGRRGRVAGNNWNGNWNGKWNKNWDHRHRHISRFRGYYPYWYGASYAYGCGNCAWLRRQAIITGSPYWWRRYQACLYY